MTRDELFEKCDKEAVQDDSKTDLLAAIVDIVLAECDAIARTYEHHPWSMNAAESDVASAVCKSIGDSIAALKDPAQ
jgi:hypothetical protein